MKRLFFGAMLLAFTSLAACSGNSDNSNSSESRESAEGAPGTYGTTTEDVPAEAGNPGRDTTTLDTVVIDTNVRGNP